jgi:hypothetical protein
MTQEEREDIKQLFGVVTEDLRSQIQQVAEGVTANGERLDRFQGTFDAFREETTRNFAAVGAEFAAVRGRLDGLDGRMDGLDGFRAETARNFTELRAETGSSRKDFDRRLKVVEARQTSRR